MNSLTRIAAGVAVASCGCLLVTGCSSSGSPPSASTLRSSATQAGSTGATGTQASSATAASAASGKLNACALVPPSMLKQFLGVTLPAGVESDSDPDGPTCNYVTTDKTESALVQTSDDPAVFMPNASFQGVEGASRATAPGITRGIVADLGGGRGRFLVVKGGIGVTVDIEFQYGRQATFVTPKHLQALTAAVAANL